MRGVSEARCEFARFDRLLALAAGAHESFVERASVKPFKYESLAVLYRKLKSVDDEIRVLKEALKNVPESSKKHREWFRERLEKLKGVK